MNKCLSNTFIIHLALSCLFILIINPACADEEWLSTCSEKSGGESIGTYECYAEYLTKLEFEQKEIVKQITASLAKLGPEGTNYNEAKKLLIKTQMEWDQFVHDDCAMGDSLFGVGNAAGMAGLDCNVQHYKIRNSQLKELQLQYLNQSPATIN